MTFYDVLLPLHKKVQKYSKAAVEKPSRALESVKEHRMIFDAIAEGDAEKAMKYSKEHVLKAHAHITNAN